MDGDGFPSARARRWVGWWLGLSWVGIGLMVMIGGITRLTESGLSIVEWDLFRGVMPPMTEAGWEEMFGKYQESPQYRIMYPEMTLAEFKGIFWWEYIHRLWGRLLGVGFAVPLLVFWVKGWLRGWWLAGCVGALVLGGAQGFLGWFMVQSGLVDTPRVSGYRLTAHLLLATALLAGVFWMWLRVTGFRRGPGLPWGRWVGLVGLVGLVWVQIGLGGFMAGTRAALVAPTFPLINGEFLPPAAFAGANVWRDLFENPFTLQFVHRVTGYVLVAGAIGWAIWAWPHVRGRTGRFLAAGIAISLGLQVVWGAATVVHAVGQVPVGWGVLHQMFGVATLLWVLATVYYLRGSAWPTGQERTEIETKRSAKFL